MRDRWLWSILVVALTLRISPAVLWPMTDCIRDECIYRAIAFKIVEGHGLTVSSKGWLPAPGYPYMLAWSKMILGHMQAIKILQVIASTASVGLLYGVAHLVSGRKVARIAAALIALNPTIAWFATTMWIETFYVFFLLFAGLAVLWAHRSGGVASAFGGGVALGVAVLFRGIATYLPPLFLLALAWPGALTGGWGRAVQQRWRLLAAFVLGLVLTVAPYSIHASARHGGFMVTDATVGHVLYLGNNDFPPLTFDYGNGMLTQPIFSSYLKSGRRMCNRKGPPVLSSRCDASRAVDWIRAHPREFVSRIPMRLAQNLNPNSFLTRHVRWGYWPGAPWWFREAIVQLIIVFGSATMVLGTLTAWARARGPWAFIAAGTVLYTMATTALMYGMSRFRLPLDVLWTVYLAMFLADPRGTFTALRDSPPRLVGALSTLPPLIALMLWYLPTGFPLFWR